MNQEDQHTNRRQHRRGAGHQHRIQDPEVTQMVPWSQGLNITAEQFNETEFNQIGEHQIQKHDEDTGYLNEKMGVNIYKKKLKDSPIK